jgi:hypothetical protein
VRHRCIAAIATFLMLAGCTKGLDRTFDTSSSNALNASITAMASESSGQEAIIFREYAPVLLMTIPMLSLTGKGPDISKLTGRQALALIITDSIQKAEKSLLEIDQKKQLAAELDKIKIAEISYISQFAGSASEDFFLLGKPVFKFRLSNESSIPISNAWIQARFYLDGQTTPVADSINLVMFHDGLEPGKGSVAKFSPAAMGSRSPAGSFADTGWDKLSVRKAIGGRVSLAVYEIQDFDKRTISRIDSAREAKLIAELANLRQQLTIVSHHS